MWGPFTKFSLCYRIKMHRLKGNISLSMMMMMMIMMVCVGWLVGEKGMFFHFQLNNWIFFQLLLYCLLLSNIFHPKYNGTSEGLETLNRSKWSTIFQVIKHLCWKRYFFDSECTMWSRISRMDMCWIERDFLLH